VQSNRDKVLVSFASGILRHFNEISIPGTYILKPDGVQIVITVYNKSIMTTIPYNVIANSVTNIEALQRMRFEIIQELTIAITKIRKTPMHYPMMPRKKRRRRRKV